MYFCIGTKIYAKLEGMGNKTKVTVRTVTGDEIVATKYTPTVVSLHHAIQDCRDYMQDLAWDGYMNNTCGIGTEFYVEGKHVERKQHEYLVIPF